MIQTQQIAAHQNKIICKRCKKIAEIFCTICWKGFCTLCTKDHQCENNRIIFINKTHSECKRQKCVDMQIKLSHRYNVYFRDDEKPVRIFGIAFLADNTIVALDWNNRKLIVFKSKEEKMKKDTIDEPCAMTVMTENKFAVTYPNQKYIQIYKLILDAKQNTYIISEEMKATILDKPFNIAYHAGKFAVEVGEGEDGRIIIYNIDHVDQKVTEAHVIPCSFSFFSGRLIRLALTDDHVFISALGKRMISCLDFAGKKIWHKSIPSPISLIVTEDHTLRDKLFVSSKMCNAIYEMKKENGNYEILKSTDEIRLPRYMAYNSDTKMFCVLVEKVHNKICKVELAFFEYKDPEQNESTSRDVETECHKLFNED